VFASWEVLREDVATYAVEEFKRQLQARLQGARSHLSVTRNRGEILKAEIANLAHAIAEGHSSAALLGELGKRERELDGISEELLAADGRGFDAKLQRSWSLFRSACRTFAGYSLLMFPGRKQNSPNTARQSRLRQRDRPSGFQEIGIYLADVRMVPGARIELATPAFSGRRSTSELPRHGRDC
jgi:hypothetical protein